MEDNLYISTVTLLVFSLAWIFLVAQHIKMLLPSIYIYVMGSKIKELANPKQDMRHMQLYQLRKEMTIIKNRETIIDAEAWNKIIT